MSKLSETLNKAMEREQEYAVYTGSTSLPPKTPKSAITSVFIVVLALIAFSLISFVVGGFMGYSQGSRHCSEVRQIENDKNALELGYCKESLDGEKANVDKVIKCSEKTSYWNFKECLKTK